MESMEFQLSDEDVPAEKAPKQVISDTETQRFGNVVKDSEENEAAEEKKRNEDKKQEDTGLEFYRTFVTGNTSIRKQGCAFCNV